MANGVVIDYEKGSIVVQGVQMPADVLQFNTGPSVGLMCSDSDDDIAYIQTVEITK